MTSRRDTSRSLSCFIFLTLSIIEHIIAMRIVDIRELEVPYAKSEISDAH